jgi:hypothetical protein
MPTRPPASWVQIAMTVAVMVGLALLAVWSGAIDTLNLSFS